jgi:uracil-DNA glycosylase family 4
MDIKSVLNSYLNSQAILLSKDKNKTESYIKLAEDILACKLCITNSPHPYPGSGNIDSKVMLIGEAPSPNRRSFENFSEKSRDVVDMMLREFKLDRSKVYMTNAIKCSLPRGEARTRTMMLTVCLMHLRREIELIDPKVIIALGDTARKAMDMIKGGRQPLAVIISLPHPMNVIYGSVSLNEYLKLVRSKCGLIRYLI